jgi:hypothetical protein
MKWYSLRAFQRMVMSIGFDIPKTNGTIRKCSRVFQVLIILYFEFLFFSDVVNSVDEKVLHSILDELVYKLAISNDSDIAK